MFSTLWCVYYDAVHQVINDADIIVLAVAIATWHLAMVVGQKGKRKLHSPLTVSLSSQ